MEVLYRIVNRKFRGIQRGRMPRARALHFTVFITGGLLPREKCSPHTQSVYRRKCLPRRIYDLRARVRECVTLTRAFQVGHILPRIPFLGECVGYEEKFAHFDRCEIRARAHFHKMKISELRIRDSRTYLTRPIPVR